ncbi:hypothetical protein RAB80_015859 [Fusarium oxysporum f. sp. vasinfectum]|nr:hypothetical protein RAB80_015859 [Fusarium oxysporum f. sp. vasinfectum]
MTESAANVLRAHTSRPFPFMATPALEHIKESLVAAPWLDAN